MGDSAIEIDAPDAAMAAYIMSELVGCCEADLVAPARGGGRWIVTLRRDREDHDLLLAAIGAVERALRRYGVGEATVRFGQRSHTLRNTDVAPRRDAA